MPRVATVLWDAFRGAFGYTGALGSYTGTQVSGPTGSISASMPRFRYSQDAALQLSTIWACIDLRARVLASLPLFVYRVPSIGNGSRTLARDTRLWNLLHDSPNSRMTPFEFWRAMMVNHDMRGNAYARVERISVGGEALALWPMPASQVEQFVQEDGSILYLYSVADTTFIYGEDDVLHLQGLGNGTMGMDKLAFMRASITEAASQQESATRTFGTNGKPTGVLMTPHVLDAQQRLALGQRFSELQNGPVGRIHVLEADFKYQQLSATPEQMELLDSRKFTTEELCRWYDTPPVLVFHSNQTAWGSGIEQIIEGWHKFTIGPLTVSIGQSLRKRVMTTGQRANMHVEFGLDALLRATPKARFDLYATATQNGIMDRDECRQLENLPPRKNGADVLTAQVNLVPLDKLGVEPAATPNAPGARPVAQ